MLRLIAWRLGFDFWNLIAAFLSWDIFHYFHRFNPPTNYFAFGANLDPQVLYRRRMKPLAQEEFLLRDYALRFTQQGPYKGFGFASVEYAPGEVTYGRLLQLTRIDCIRMDYSELVPFMKRHRRVVHTQEGQTFYFYQATNPKLDLFPTEEYKGKILQAAEQSAIIPPELLENLRTTPTLDQLEPVENFNFFVKEYKAWPPFLTRIQRHYDTFCSSLFRKMLFLSLTQNLIKME